MKKTKNLFSVLGVLVGVIIIICGILFLNGKLAPINGYYVGTISSYDYGYASFGADFYTYVSNNAYIAAQHARGAAEYASQIAKMTRNFFGIFLISFGCLACCLFGSKISFEDFRTNSENVIKNSGLNNELSTETESQL